MIQPGGQFLEQLASLQKRAEEIAAVEAFHCPLMKDLRGIAPDGFIRIELWRERPADLVEIEQRLAEHGELRRDADAGIGCDHLDIEDFASDLTVADRGVLLLRDEFSHAAPELELVEIFARLTDSYCDVGSFVALSFGDGEEQLEELLLHGGIDPGAIGANNVNEKTIVLAVALQLKEELLKTGLYEVKMTRSDDVFVSLDNRLKFSRKSTADLFISLHADSIEEKSAGSVRGATIYTLSNTASDKEARIMAEKENASDLLAGIENIDERNEGQVKSILIDLMKRETSNFSADFSQVLAKRLGKTIAMSRIPRRSAAFKVLKQTNAPSVLVELGYISNRNDEEQMLTPEWQAKVASAVAGAVQLYFNKRTAASP